MKKNLFAAILAICSAVASAAQYEVALVVQNHTSNTPVLPISQIADTLSKALSAGGVFSVILPENSIGVNQNRTAAGEQMPQKSAVEIGRTLGADGVVTASIQELTSEDILYEGKVISHRLQSRITLNLYDAAKGGTACEGATITNSFVETAEKVKSNAALYYERILHSAAEECSARLLANVKASNWKPTVLKKNPCVLRLQRPRREFEDRRSLSRNMPDGIRCHPGRP